MGKSSSSLKKKRSKNSSKVKASSRSKSKKYKKSKKVRHREVSPSVFDYDNSESSDTLASSSSEDSYRRKRDRSRARKDVKGHRKKTRKRSYSRGSSEDSHYSRKRKKGKRKNEYDEKREKLHKKKKIRREASVSSMSSRSRSCSTCQEGGSSSDDDQYESRRGRSEGKEKDRRRLRGRSGSEKSGRYSVRSCSSCTPCSENSDEGTKEKYTNVGENNSRWLRSVITVTKETEESGELFRNETKEEIVDDYDYPCKSPDSNDGGTKRELEHPTLNASEEKLRVDDEMEDMNADLIFADQELRDKSQNHSNNIKAYGAGTSEAEKKETSDASGPNLSGDELEAILRQRALANLRKFRGEGQSSTKASDQKNKVVSQVKQPMTGKLEPVQGKSIVNDVVVGTKFDKSNLTVERRNLIAYQRNNERTLTRDKEISVSAKHLSACAPEKVIHADRPSGSVTKPTSHSTSNLELTALTQKSCHESLQTAALHEPPNTKFQVTEGDIERNAAKATQASIQSIDKNGGHVDEVCNSAIPEFEGSSVENKSGKLPDESNQGSQFEQKTMNVMRGGEMVQVSYKVYIPNRVPALARRKLKR